MSGVDGAQFNKSNTSSNFTFFTTVGSWQIPPTAKQHVFLYSCASYNEMTNPRICLELTESHKFLDGKCRPGNRRPGLI